MITRSTIDRSLYVIEKTELVEKIVAGIHRSGRGRRTNVDNIRMFVLGMFLAVQDNRAATIQAIFETLTNELTIDDQVRLGITELTLTQLQNVSKLLDTRLEYGPVTAPDLDDEERDRRRQVVAGLAAAVCDLFTDGFDSTTFAIDATGVWGWQKAGRSTETNSDQLETDLDDQSEPAAGRSSRKATDAGWGQKTAKSGKEESFFGFHEHTMVIVPHGEDDPQQPPPLVARFGLSRPSADLAAVTLELIDSYQEVTRVVVDRHYSYKTSETWRDELARRGIAQVLDLRINEQGWTDLDGIRFAASVPHCPAAPDSLGTIPHPGPDATPSELAAFRERINQRKAFALKLNRTIDPVTGKSQYICPARNGTIACPLIPASVQAAGEIMTKTGTNIPIVQNPPDPNDPICPQVCTQATVVINPGPLRKHIQPDYWGSREWGQEYRKRTYVEGSYGNRKNSSTENYRRGYHRAGGIGKGMIFSLAAVVSYNLRMLRNWHERTGLGDPNNPLLTPDDQVYGYRPLTEEEYQRELRAA